MEFRKLTKTEARRWFDELLPECFVPDEIKPWADFERLLAEGRYEIWGLFEAPAESNVLRTGAPLPLGFATLWKNPEYPVCLLDYLGVRPALRSGGLGAKILAELASRGIAALAEAEVPIPGADEAENALRVRRMGFYARNGYTRLYEMSTCGMRMQTFGINTAQFDPADIMYWHKHIYDEKRTDVKVPLGPDEVPAPPYWMK